MGMHPPHCKGASWCHWDLVQWFILARRLCSFITIPRPRAFPSLQKGKPGAIGVTKSLTRMKQEEECSELRTSEVCEDNSPLGKYQQESFWPGSVSSGKAALDLYRNLA